jgi:hypothetical protein
MLSRVNDTLNLLLLRTSERIEDLSPFSKAMLVIALFALLMLGIRFGIIPRRHPRLYR